jgi:hypothetical protein
VRHKVAVAVSDIAPDLLGAFDPAPGCQRILSRRDPGIARTFPLPRST